MDTYISVVSPTCYDLSWLR